MNKGQDETKTMDQVAGKHGLLQKLAEVMAGCPAVRTCSPTAGPQFEYQSAAAVDNAVRPLLIEQGIVIVPTVQSIEDVWVELPERGGGTEDAGYGVNNLRRQRVVRVMVQWRIVAGSPEIGAVVTLEMPGEGSDANGHGLATALRMSRRLMLQHLFMLIDEAGQQERAQGRNQGGGRTRSATENQLKAIRNMAAESGVVVDDICRDMGVSALKDLTIAQASAVIKKLRK